jgi:nucleoside-diphosphate-sugar epimerase
MRIAMTGGTGFVGGHAIAAARARGHAVIALARKEQAPRDGVAWVRGDLADLPALKRLVEGADAVVHIAGVVNAGTASGFFQGNVAGTAAMRAVAGKLPFVHVSSLAAREPQLSRYGASKRQAEDIVRGCAGPWAMVRPPAVYGPGDRDLLALFRAVRAGVVPLPSGRAVMIHGADLGACLVALAEDLAGEGVSAGGCFEVDDGCAGLTQADLARAIAAALGRGVRVLPVPGVALKLGAALDTVRARLVGGLPTLSFDRASYLAHPDWTTDSGPIRALGVWAPAIGLAEGLRQTADWYRAEGLL